MPNLNQITEAELLDAAAVENEIVEMDEEAAANPLKYWQNSVVGSGCRSNTYPTRCLESQMQFRKVGDRIFVFKLGEDKRKILNNGSTVLGAGERTTSIC